MKSISRRAIILVFLGFFLQPGLSRAFNPATHIFIAEKAFPGSTERLDLDYGSIAPDLALSVPDTASWETPFQDTHYNYIDLRPYARGSIQKAFARGWLTHNEAWGADHSAHKGYCGKTSLGYVIEKSQELMLWNPDLTADFAHYAIEVAIDLLVKGDDPGIGEKLLKADLFRSPQDRRLLARVLVWKERRTDWITLALVELSFRNLVGRYAMALALPSPMDKKAIVELGVELAREKYGIEVSPEELGEILEKAMALCRGDYREVIDCTVERIREHL